MFYIEDEIHAEGLDEKHSTFQDAVDELKSRAKTSWNVPPNVAPCQSWRTCGRFYVIIEYDVSTTPWKEPSRRAAMEISADWCRLAS